MEFTAADIFQHSPFGDILNSLKHLSLSGEPWPNYGQDCWDADDEEIQSPPTTHFVATVDDLTDVLDYDSEDINGMDDDAEDHLVIRHIYGGHPKRWGRRRSNGGRFLKETAQAPTSAAPL